MDYKNLGRTGLKVSRLCLGTMNFGALIPEQDCFQIFDRALEVGITFIDTADGYGINPGDGETEKIIGRWIAQGNSRREKIVLATKAYNKMGDGLNDERLSAYHIRQACEDSLRRLQTDHIDLYQMHHIDRETPWDEIWQAMELLIQQGKVIYTGSSNFAGYQIAQAQCEAQKKHLYGLVSEQSYYNLFERTVELEVIPACQEYGLGLIPYSPRAGGLLGGVLKKMGDGRRAGEEIQGILQKHRAQVESYEQLCNGMGQEPANVALAWLLNNPIVTAPIIGPHNVDQLDQSLGALDIKFPTDVLCKLDEIWPGPGGSAPEAYAW